MDTLLHNGLDAASEALDIRSEVDSDEALLAAYRDGGDRHAFSELVRRYERELYSYLARYLGDAEAAEDAFQAAFLQVHLKCESFEEGRRFRPWLYTIATNQAIDFQRRNRRHRILSLDRPHSSHGDDAGSISSCMAGADLTPEETLSGQEDRQRIAEAVEELPESLREAVRLVYFQDLKYREAAEILGIPVGTVKSRLHAAMQKLSESWNRDLADAA
jgi:RNA polymerase sigma-70 factor, ECF subfamily